MLHNKVEVEHEEEEQIYSHQYIIEYTHSFAVVKMLQNGLIEVRVPAKMLQAEQAWVITEEACDQNDQEAEKSAAIHSQDGENQNEASNHAINHGNDDHIFLHGYRALLLISSVKILQQWQNQWHIENKKTNSLNQKILFLF